MNARKGSNQMIVSAEERIKTAVNLEALAGHLEKAHRRLGFLPLNMGTSGSTKFTGLVTDRFWGRNTHLNNQILRAEGVCACVWGLSTLYFPVRLEHFDSIGQFREHRFGMEYFPACFFQAIGCREPCWNPEWFDLCFSEKLSDNPVLRIKHLRKTAVLLRRTTGRME